MTDNTTERTAPTNEIARLRALVLLARDAMTAGPLVKTPYVNEAVAAIDAEMKATS